MRVIGSTNVGGEGSVIHCTVSFARTAVICKLYIVIKQIQLEVKVRRIAIIHSRKMEKKQKDAIYEFGLAHARDVVLNKICYYWQYNRRDGDGTW